MKTHSRDLLVLIDDTVRAKRAIESLTFVPPLRILQLHLPPEPGSLEEEPLVYLLGSCPAMMTPGALAGWLDSLREADSAPVVFLLPREDPDWTAAVTHPQFCGLLPCRPEVSVDSMEGVLLSARRDLARRWGQGTVRRARLRWTFSAQEAADPEQAWLLLESSLASVIGPSTDLACLGMAFGEALTNAVEHGALELDSSLKDAAADGLLRFLQERERRLLDPAYSSRRIRVEIELRGSTLHVRVRHNGRGFDPAEARPDPGGRTESTLSHGLGFAMIESLVDEVSLAPDGRTVTLTHHVPRTHIRSRGMLPGLLADERRPAA